MAKVLVTGANGFLGGWLTRELVRLGHDVCILVRPNSNLSDLEGLKYIKFFGDVTDLESLKSAFTGIDTVFHLAGLIAYKASQRPAMENVNVNGTANVVKACLEKNIRRLVHLSSVVAVGAGFKPDQIMNEESAYNIHDLNLGYFETKRKAEEIVLKAHKENGLDCVLLNPSTIYGPGDAKKGSRGSQLSVARGKLKFYTSGGVSVVSIEDVVSAIIKAWQVGRSGERYILSGDNITIKKLFEIIAQEAGVTAPQIHMPDFLLHLIGKTNDFLARFGIKSFVSAENAWTATLYHWFDSSKARRELDFHPRPAEIAIAQSVQWMKENHLLEAKAK